MRGPQRSQQAVEEGDVSRYLLPLYRSDALHNSPSLIVQTWTLHMIAVVEIRRFTKQIRISETIWRVTSPKTKLLV